jgi:hypothetical protein
MRHSLFVFAAVAACAAAQTVTLQSVVVNGGQVTVTYSKDFATCAHLKTLGGQLVHAQNWFCTSGTNVAITVALNGFNSLLQLGIQVILCHGNNGSICSAPTLVTVNPAFVAAPPTLSLATGGVHQLTVISGPLAAGATYLIGGSASGTTPGFQAGLFFVPLNLDDYFTLTASSPNTPPFSGFQGILDVGGDGIAFIGLPGGLPPSLAGLTLNHAVGIITAGGIVVGVSAATALTLVP